MRLTDFEWVAIRAFLPNKPRGIPRVKTGASAERERHYVRTSPHIQRNKPDRI
jgi:hypothetical protein